MREYYREHGFSDEDFAKSDDILHCTGLDVHVTSIHFASRELELLGKMLGVADLLGQMADRHYLEKLPCLFREFQEGGVTFFSSEHDLMAKTPQFREMNKRRFAQDLDSMDRVMRLHFRERWGMDRDFYTESIERQIGYLQQLLIEQPRDLHVGLRRRERLKKKGRCRGEGDESAGAWQGRDES